MKAAIRLATLKQRNEAQLEVDPDVVRRLSVLPEERVLDYFWLMVREGAVPIVVLLQLTRVVVKRPATWCPAAIRREHEHDGGACHVERRYCFACQASKVRLYLHHVVEVHHGGSNSPRNKVPLCFLCHQYLHPWLKDEPPPSHVHGFESLYNIAKRCGLPK